MTDPTDWRREVGRLATQLGAYHGKKRLNHRSRARLERLTMTAYYLLHKLMEDHRVPGDVETRAIEVRSTRAQARSHYLVDYQRILHALEEHPPRKESLSTGVLANKVIHSYLILPISDPGAGLNELVIASDFEHFDRLIVASLQDLVAPLASVASGPP